MLTVVFGVTVSLGEKSVYYELHSSFDECSEGCEVVYPMDQMDSHVSPVFFSKFCESVSEQRQSKNDIKQVFFATCLMFFVDIFVMFVVTFFSFCLGKEPAMCLVLFRL